MNETTLVFSTCIAGLSTIGFFVLLLKSKLEKELVPIFLGGLFVLWTSIAFIGEQKSVFFNKHLSTPLIVMVFLSIAYSLFCLYRMVKHYIQDGTRR